MTDAARDWRYCRCSVKRSEANQRDVADNYPKQSQLSTGESAGYTNQTAFASLNC